MAPSPFPGTPQPTPGVLAPRGPAAPQKDGSSTPPAQQYLSAQVWGIGCVDRALYFRQGVTQSELSGKTWKAIVAGREGDRSLSGSSISLLR